MATATLVIVILCAVGLGAILWRTWHPANVGLLQSQPSNAEILECVERVESMCVDIRDVLTKASAIKAQKQDSVFDRDTITPTNQKPRYISLAIRRAQAERASLGPVTHDDRVRENNARAIESAG